MIDIYDAKNSLAGYFLNEKYEFSEKNIYNLIEIVKALEEAKEIISKTAEYAHDESPSIKWLSKFKNRRSE